MSPDEVKKLLEKPTITPQELFDSKMLPGSRNHVYDAIRDGSIQSFRTGKLIVIPTAPLRRKLGMGG